MDGAKVWVLTIGYSYEGEEVIGVYSTEEAALAVVELTKRRKRREEVSCDYIAIYTVDLDAEPEINSCFYVAAESRIGYSIVD